MTTPTMRFDIAGSGPTLVLVHGVVHRRQAWNPVLDRLTPYRRVVTVDLLGHGESDALDMSTGDPLETLVDAVDHFVTGFEDDGLVHVAGNSLGGWVALALGCRGRVASATALSPAGFFANDLDRWRTVTTFRALRSLSRGLGDRAPDMLRHKAIRYPSLLPFFAHPSRVGYEDAVADAASLLSNKFIESGVEASFALTDPVRPEIPMTVAWGGRDLLLPRYQIKHMRRQLPDARVFIVPGVGHVPMSDNPDVVASILLAGSETPTSR